MLPEKRCRVEGAVHLVHCINSCLIMWTGFYLRDEYLAIGTHLQLTQWYNTYYLVI